VLALPGQWETIRSIEGSLTEILQYGLPDDYYQKYPAMVQKLSIGDLSKAAEKTVHPESIIWVVVGDRAKITPGIRGLGLGEILFLDGDGNLLPAGE
jgi:zinc protease